jgi:molybdopterin-guanine dinucleotide biosynthesis protein A
MTDPGVSGIVLAGGAARRFGGDKLAAPFGGRPLLDRAVDALAALASEVIVVVAPGDDRRLPTAPVPVSRAIDPERHGGPLVGLLAGLEVAREPIAVVVGGDMPTLAPDVLALLARSLRAHEGSADAAVLVQRGALRPLPAAVRNGAATHAARRLIGEGERSLRRLFDDLHVHGLDEMEWRSLDPEGTTLRDVDRPEDLPRDGSGETSRT